MVTHVVEYYSALKRKEVLTPATTWMNLGDVMPSEITQTQKDTHCLIPLTGGPRGVRSVETGRRWQGLEAGGWGREGKVTVSWGQSFRLGR